MNTARQAGRISAFSFALGLGVAVATTAGVGVASADTGSTTKSSASSASTGSAAKAPEHAGLAKPKSSLPGKSPVRVAAATQAQAATPAATAASAARSARPATGAAAPTGSPHPLDSAALVGALDAARREIEHFFSLDPVTADPRQVVVSPSDGTVLGTVDAGTPNDQLTYAVTQQPKFGTVSLDSTGGYVYTPNPDLLAAGGTCGATACFDGYSDTFNVSVTDTSFTLRTLANFITGRPNTVSVPVTVNVPTVYAGSGIPPLTQGFDVYNATRQPITLTFYDFTKGAGNATQAPPVGAVIQPGDSQHFEVIYYVGNTTSVAPSFQSADGTMVWSVTMGTSTFNEAFAGCSSNASCSPAVTFAPDGKSFSYTRSQLIVLMEKPGTVVTIPAGQGQKQAEVLNKLCAGGGIATCSFVATSSEVTYSKPKVVWDYQTSSSTTTLGETIKSTNTSTNSLEVSAKAGLNIKMIVSAEIAAKYGRTWTDSVEVSKTVTMTVPPYTLRILYAEYPVTRYTGDFTVKIGNTTYYLQNVYFDQPDATRQTRYRETDRKVLPPASVSA
jgi:VCBS repeat-containing protein